MKTLTALGLVVVAFSHCLGAEPVDDKKALQGTWLPTAGEMAGNPFPAEGLKSLKLILTDGKYTVKTPQGNDEGSYTIDPSKKPKTLIIKGTEGPNKDKTFLCIYELDGDKLRVCYDLSGKGHPTEFKTKPNTQLFLLTYQRDKKQ